MATFQPAQSAGSETKERRKDARTRIPRHRLISVDVGERSSSAFLVDASETGFALESRQPLDQGAQETLSFKPVQDSSITADTTVVWTADGKSGLRVVSIDDASRAALKQWLSEFAGGPQPIAPAGDATSAADLISGNAPDETELYSHVARARILTCANGAAIAWMEQGVMVCRASTGDAPPCGVHVQMEQGLSGECVRTGNVVRCDDTENDKRVDPEVCRQLNLRSVLILPIKRDGAIIGLLEVFSSKPQAFNGEDVDGLVMLADECGRIPEPADHKPPGAEPSSVVPFSSNAGAPKPVPAASGTDTVPPVVAIRPAYTPPVPPAAHVTDTPPPATADTLAPATADTPPPAAAGNITAHPFEVPIRTFAPAPAEPPVDRMTRLKVIGPLAFAAVLLLGGAIYVASRVSSARSARQENSVEQPVAAQPSPDNAATAAPLAASPEAPQTGGVRTKRNSSSSNRSRTPARQSNNEPPPDQNDIQEVATTGNNAAGETPQQTPAAAEVPAPALPLSGGKDNIASVLNSAPSGMPALRPGSVINHISQGRLIHRVNPRYPSSARLAGRAGTVVLRITVASNGHVKNVRVVSGDPDLSRAAIDAVLQWRYEPYKIDDKPVDAEAEVRIGFALADSQARR